MSSGPSTPKSNFSSAAGWYKPERNFMRSLLLCSVACASVYTEDVPALMTTRGKELTAGDFVQSFAKYTGKPKRLRDRDGAAVCGGGGG
jgi:hypothetical protein